MIRCELESSRRLMDEYHRRLVAAGYVFLEDRFWPGPGADPKAAGHIWDETVAWWRLRIEQRRAQ